MRNFSLVIVGLIFVVSCSEEDHRIDLSYTGEQLRFVDAPVGGIETGHVLINGDGSIRVFNIFGNPATGSQQTSATFFSLYAAEEGAAAVVRIMGKVLLDDSSGVAGGSRGVESLRISEGSGGLGGSKGSGGLGSSGGSEGSKGSEGSGSSGEVVQKLEAAKRFDEAVFHNAFPLVQVDLLDDEVPLQVRMSAWSPFIPIDILNSNLPVAVFEWELTNPGKKPVSYSIALTMENPLGVRGQNGRFPLNEYIITPHTISGWKGFTFSNDEGGSLVPGTRAVRVLSSSENAFYVPLIGDRQKALEQFWTHFFFTDGKLESQDDIVGSSGRLESRGNKVRTSGGLESDGNPVSSSDRRKSYSDAVSSSGRPESRDDTVNSSGRMEPESDPFSSSSVDLGMAALYSSGVLDPGETVTIPFLFSWYVPFGHAGERLAADAGERDAAYKKTGISFDDMPSTSGAKDKPSASCSEDKLSAICSEDKASRSESKPLASSFKSIDEITGYMVSGYENLRDKTMQLSHSMITSTISPEALDTVLSGFANAVKQRGGNAEVIISPFPKKETNGISTADRSSWDIYHAASGFAYDEEERVMKFSPAIDVLPVRFFWATESGWGTINVSRARIVLECIHGSVELQELLLEGRSFFVFREYVPSQNADISYDNETLVINFPEELSITEGMSFTMEIP